MGCTAFTPVFTPPGPSIHPVKVQVTYSSPPERARSLARLQPSNHQTHTSCVWRQRQTHGRSAQNEVSSAVSELNIRQKLFSIIILFIHLLCVFLYSFKETEGIRGLLK